MAWTHGKFYWNELMTRDVERDKKFYGDAIGWTFDGMPMPDGTYWVANIGGQPVGGLFPINAPQFKGVPEGWMSYHRGRRRRCAREESARPRRNLDAADLRCAGRRPHRDPERTGRRRHRLDDAGLAGFIFRNA